MKPITNTNRNRKQIVHQGTFDKVFFIFIFLWTKIDRVMGYNL